MSPSPPRLAPHGLQSTSIWKDKDREPHAGAFLEFESLRCEIKEEVIVKPAAEVAFSLLKATDVVVGYLASSARVESTPTGYTLTVTTVDGGSSGITCSPSMLEAARVDLERVTPRGDPDAELGPTRITITSCMANPVGTSQLTAEALTDRRKEYGFDTDKCEVPFQDFDVVPLYIRQTWWRE